MRHFISLALIIILGLGLAGCGKPDRKTADIKLLDACVAAVKILYSPEDTFDIKEKSFSKDKEKNGLELRKVHVMAHYVQNGGYIQMKEYNCWFEEVSGFMGFSQKFHRLEKDGQRFGNFDGTMEGDFQDLLKIQDAMEVILRK